MTPEAELAEITRSKVVLILKPAQSRTILFDKALRKIAVSGQFMSESKVVSVVSNVPQAGVTAYIFVVFNNIRTPKIRVLYKPFVL